MQLKHPANETPTEQQKRWLSWQRVTNRWARDGNGYGVKHSYQGIDVTEKAKRRAKGKAQRQARKANR